MGCCGRKASRPKRNRGRARFRKGVIAQQLLAQSQGTKMPFLMCRPLFYEISYSINPWMDVKNQSSQEVAINQWRLLESKIKELGGKTKFVKPQKNLPDMVFTANAGLLLKNGKVLVSNFKCPERKGEEHWFEDWFKANSHEVILTNHSFEGAGDALYLGETLIGGYGFRSDLQAYKGLTDVTVKLVDPYFYHLDTCFCPLDGTDYMVWPGAFESGSLAKIRLLGGDEITVPENEAKLFACNAVRINRHVILPAGCPETMSLLADKGYTTHPLNMSEFIKAGGACKCLTLALS